MKADDRIEQRDNDYRLHNFGSHLPPASRRASAWQSQALALLQLAASKGSRPARPTFNPATVRCAEYIVNIVALRARTATEPYSQNGHQEARKEPKHYPHAYDRGRAK